MRKMECIGSKMGAYDEMRKNGVLSKDGRGSFRYLWAWLGSMGIFLLCEMFIDESICHSVYIPLDDLVPFSEVFVFFYVLWYFLILGSLIRFAVYSARGFERFLKYMTVCQLIAVVIFVAFPNKQELRPEAMPRENVFSFVTSVIHSVDTNTNVCPSLHVCYSFAMLSVWMREGKRRITKALYLLLALLISASTVFIKQHSVLDFLVALPVCLVAEIFANLDFWKIKFTKT